jgi:hypothetical protein
MEIAERGIESGDIELFPVEVLGRGANNNVEQVPQNNFDEWIRNQVITGTGYRSEKIKRRRL